MSYGRVARIHIKAIQVVEGGLRWSVPAVVAVMPVQRLWPVVPACLAYGVWRGATLSVREDDGGITVRGYGRTSRFEWDDVLSVEWYEPTPGSHVPALRVRGRRMRVTAWAMTGWFTPRSREDAARVRRWAERTQNDTS